MPPTVTVAPGGEVRALERDRGAAGRRAGRRRSTENAQPLRELRGVAQRVGRRRGDPGAAAVATGNVSSNVASPLPSVVTCAVPIQVCALEKLAREVRAACSRRSRGRRPWRRSSGARPVMWVDAPVVMDLNSGKFCMPLPPVSTSPGSLGVTPSGLPAGMTSMPEAGVAEDGVAADHVALAERQVDAVAGAAGVVPRVGDDVGLAGADPADRWFPPPTWMPRSPLPIATVPVASVPM